MLRSLMILVGVTGCLIVNVASANSYAWEYQTPLKNYKQSSYPALQAQPSFFFFDFDSRNRDRAQEYRERIIQRHIAWRQQQRERWQEWRQYKREVACQFIPPHAQGGGWCSASGG